jgi:hypothetical protein
MGVYLTGVHLTGVYLTGVHFTGVYLMGVHFMGVHHRMQPFYLSRTYVFAAFGNLALGPIAPGRSPYPQYLRAQGRSW